MSDRGVWDGTAVKKIRSEEVVYDDWEIDEHGADEEEITVHDVDAVLGYSVDILRLGIYMLLGALVVGLIYVVFPYL